MNIQELRNENLINESSFIFIEERLNKREKFYVSSQMVRDAIKNYQGNNNLVVLNTELFERLVTRLKGNFKYIYLKSCYEVSF